ncbi:hypothetical protein B0H10DRAFT_2371293 [Mycena sp. CBHHK59/15]|nr:hypothetical protein B0H10DRAFT_2371293 [Mycena sp. CBHHK59/15]
MKFSGRKVRDVVIDGNPTPGLNADHSCVLRDRAIRARRKLSSDTATPICTVLCRGSECVACLRLHDSCIFRRRPGCVCSECCGIGSEECVAICSQISHARGRLNLGECRADLGRAALGRPSPTPRLAAVTSTVCASDSRDNPGDHLILRFSVRSLVVADTTYIMCPPARRVTLIFTVHLLRKFLGNSGAPGSKCSPRSLPLVSVRFAAKFLADLPYEIVPLGS